MTRLLALILVAVAAVAGLCATPASASVPPLMDIRSVTCHAVTPAAANPTPAEVAALPFACNGAPKGYEKGWLWQRYDNARALATVNGTSVLLIDQTRFSRIRVFVRYDDGSLFVSEIRSDAMDANWGIGGYVYALAPKRAAQPVAIDIGFENLASWDLVRRIRLFGTGDYLGFERGWTLLIGLVGGAALASIFYNLFLLTGLRDAYIRHYVLWALFALGHAVAWSNALFVFAPGLAGSWGARLNLWLAAGAVFYSLRLFGSFMEPGILGRRYVHLLTAIGTATIFAAVFASFEGLVPTMAAHHVYHGLLVTGIVAVAGGLVTALGKGSRAARFYAVAWILPTLALANRMIHDLLRIPRLDVTDQVMLGAAALQMVLLSVAMADRFVRFRSERDRAAAEREELRTLAETDLLTGLFNRRGFVARAQAMLAAQPARFGLLLLDLDHFKAVNDAHGHDTGDLALARVGQALGRALRDGDIAGRLGGEEFGVAVPVIDKPNLLQLAERIRAEVAATDLGDIVDSDLRLTVSIGVAAASDIRSGGFERLYKVADQAMYRAKLDGRNRVAEQAAEPPLPFLDLRISEVMAKA